MSKLIKPEGYRAILNLKQTELAIKQIKDFFLRSLSTELRLRRVTAPLFVLRGLGLNDDLNGVERAVSFPIKDMGESVAEVVHSLAKWKRVTLAEYEVQPGYGIITGLFQRKTDIHYLPVKKNFILQLSALKKSLLKKAVPGKKPQNFMDSVKPAVLQVLEISHLQFIISRIMVIMPTFLFRSM